MPTQCCLCLLGTILGYISDSLAYLCWESAYRLPVFHSKVVPLLVSNNKERMDGKFLAKGQNRIFHDCCWRALHGSNMYLRRVTDRQLRSTGLRSEQRVRCWSTTRKVPRTGWAGNGQARELQQRSSADMVLNLPLIISLIFKPEYRLVCFYTILKSFTKIALCTGRNKSLLVPVQTKNE